MGKRRALPSITERPRARARRPAGKLREVSALDSIGILYSLVTAASRLRFNSDEYKIMGLAPYGDPARYRGSLRKPCNCAGGLDSHSILRLNRSRDERETYSATRQFLAENLVKERRPQERIASEHHRTCRRLQSVGPVMLHIGGSFWRRNRAHALALAGGVALNCTATGASQIRACSRKYTSNRAGDSLLRRRSFTRFSARNCRVAE